MVCSRMAYRLWQFDRTSLWVFKVLIRQLVGQEVAGSNPAGPTKWFGGIVPIAEFWRRAGFPPQGTMSNMSLELQQNRVRTLMSLFVTEIKHAGAMRRTDLQRVSETIVIPLFAEVFGYSLRNLNDKEGGEFPSIDLADEQRRLSIQVTSQSNSNKVRDCLRKFVVNRLYERFDRLIVYILSERKKTYAEKSFVALADGKIAFDVKRDIQDSSSVVAKVAHFDIEKCSRIETLLKRNILDRSLFAPDVPLKIEKTILPLDCEFHRRLGVDGLPITVSFDLRVRGATPVDPMECTLELVMRDTGQDPKVYHRSEKRVRLTGELTRFEAGLVYTIPWAGSPSTEGQIGVRVVPAAESRYTVREPDIVVGRMYRFLDRASRPIIVERVKALQWK